MRKKIIITLLKLFGMAETHHIAKNPQKKADRKPTEAPLFEHKKKEGVIGSSGWVA